MNDKQNMHDQWSRDYRNRMEPVIRARFKERGQTDEEATDYIAMVCWEHPAVAIARILSNRSAAGSSRP